ncbi:hypothetical protein BU25DRAFT_440019 [Macroventuria anomochaeta]|uniref:Uncharacterized protein n=1 Tax=Macroventuria anomochaeta TaxID=301207 RepID=A0ACB6S024_9PLEO|nr:uncharacterized protein BU25DRAFT_440019 [Macroventuria anomochaeta]KAF2627635.1 hypothetical protein BU25DRAFT_440019 [Macroventuria anomochaeta]
MSTIPRREFSLQLDTATPTPSATASSTFTTPTPTALNNTCSSSSDSAPFAPAGSLGAESTTHLDTGTAIGIGVGVAVLVVLMIGVGFWFFRIRKGQQPITSPEAPPTTRDRSASTATKWTIDNDQRTLVASMPNSPQHAIFAAQTPGLPSEFYTTPGKVMEDEEKVEGEKEIAENRQRDVRNQNDQTPRSPVDKVLPVPPTEERRYAINVNINKSMIFDDVMFNAASYAASPVSTPHERVPRYRFEEYLPPVPPSNPRISITRTQDRPSSTISSEYELENYPHGSGYTESNRNSKSDAGSEYSESQGSDPRGNALSKLEGGLSLPELAPPSPSLSFRSYDWYQDIIGGDQSAVEQPAELPITPELPTRNPARGVNPLFSNPPDIDSSLMPEPLSPAFPSPVASSHLHPSSARLSYLPSPTNPNFRLSPTVYQMPNPNRVSKSVPSLPSTRPSTTTQKSHYSRSWLPDDGLYLPEEGTEDCFEVFKRERLASRPTSYSPLA